MSFRIEKTYSDYGLKHESSKHKKIEHTNFQSILEKEINTKANIKISAHAKQRIQQRNIQLEGADMKSIEEAMTTLEQKGSKESLILYRDMALIASVNNKTIITAMAQEEMDVITNIDSAVIIK